MFQYTHRGCGWQVLSWPTFRLQITRGSAVPQVLNGPAMLGGWAYMCIRCVRISCDTFFRNMVSDFNFSVLAKLLFLVRAFPRVVLAALSRSLGVGLFFLQFLDWWYNQEQLPSVQTLTHSQPPAPQIVRLAPLYTQSPAASHL